MGYQEMLQNALPSNWDWSYWRLNRGPELANAYQFTILTACALYVPLVLMIQRLMKPRAPFKLYGITFLWNVLLSFVSFVGMMIMLFGQPEVLFAAFFPEPQFSPSTRAVITLFSLTKGVEFGDTMLLVLKRKPLTFLHCYHHVTVAMFCWYAIKLNVPFAHIFVFVNLGIHAFMYCYYALATLASILAPESKSGWKNSRSISFVRSILKSYLGMIRPYITMTQLTQMFVGLGLSINAYFTGNLSKNHKNNCLLSIGMYLSYAILFSNFYFQNYIRTKSVGEKVVSSKGGRASNQATSTPSKVVHERFPEERRAPHLMRERVRQH